MISVFKSAEALSRAAAEYIYSFGQQCVDKRGRFDLVLSGGRTPAQTYRQLAAKTKSDTAT